MTMAKMATLDGGCVCGGQWFRVPADLRSGRVSQAATLACCQGCHLGILLEGEGRVVGDSGVPRAGLLRWLLESVPWPRIPEAVGLGWEEKQSGWFSEDLSCR